MNNTLSKIYFSWLVCLLFSINSFAQKNAIDEKRAEKNFYVIDKVEEHQVVLRWAPVSPELWKAANQVGYHIDRLEIPSAKEQFPDAKYQRLNSSPIQPWERERWESLVETNDHAAIAYMTIYAEEPNIEGDFFSIMKTQDENRKKSYFYAMTAASQSPAAAEAMGLRFEDTNIKPNTRYIYRVYPAMPLNEQKMDTAMVMVNTADITLELPPIGVEALSFEKKVVIRWPTAINRELFSSFHIEKSERPEGPFTRINDLPLLQLMSKDIPEFNEHYKFQDSLTQNYVPYYYRVIGKTYFGEESTASSVVMGMGKDLTPPVAPKITSAEINDDVQVEIKWMKQDFESDFRGFIVGRSALAEGPFTPLHDELLPRITSRFIDKTPNTKGNNFYQISALDTAGNVSRSFMKYVLFPDTFPPAPPRKLVGSIDSSGVVTIKWAANTEPDLKGYRVYFANSADHAFMQISPNLSLETEYKDSITLNTLTEEIHYRVIAVDNGFGHSEFSEILTLKRPDIIAPSSGVFTNYKVTDNTVLLEWAPSSSKDAIQQLLYRSSGDETEIIGRFNMNTSQFVDKDIKNGMLYSYNLAAKDDDGLMSKKSKAINIKITDSKKEEPVKNLTVLYNKERNAMELHWNYDTISSDLRFVIYRAIEGQGLMSYKSVTGTSHFDDFNLRSTGEYVYAIMAISSEGKSDLSERITVVLAD